MLALELRKGKKNALVIRILHKIHIWQFNMLKLSNILKTQRTGVKEVQDFLV